MPIARSGGATLDASFHAVRRFGHVVSALGWGTHALAPLSATYSGVFTLLPLLSSEGRAHHGEILRPATKLVEAGKVLPRLDPRHFTLRTIDEAYVAQKERPAPAKSSFRSMPPRPQRGKSHQYSRHRELIRGRPGLPEVVVLVFTRKPGICCA